MYYPACAAVTQAPAGAWDGVPALTRLSGCLCKTLQQSQEAIKGDEFKEKVQLPLYYATLYCNAIQTFIYKYFMCKI